MPLSLIRIGLTDRAWHGVSSSTLSKQLPISCTGRRISAFSSRVLVQRYAAGGYHSFRKFCISGIQIKLFSEIVLSESFYAFGFCWTQWVSSRCLSWVMCRHSTWCPANLFHHQQRLSMQDLSGQRTTWRCRWAPQKESLAKGFSNAITALKYQNPPHERNVCKTNLPTESFTTPCSPKKEARAQSLRAGTSLC